MIRPTLDWERDLLRRGATTVAGIDEVGRGALAGPVSVGVVTVDIDTSEVPAGLADSKLISAPVRESLVPRIQEWCTGHAVGHASAAEVDALGILGALRQAALRGLAALPIAPDIVILDGSHNWLAQADDLFCLEPAPVGPIVHVRVKADQQCASVAAASVLAKVERDRRLVALDAEFPGYGFAQHKGYGSESHREAIRALGACVQHRHSWRLLPEPRT